MNRAGQLASGAVGAFAGERMRDTHRSEYSERATTMATHYADSFETWIEYPLEVSPGAWVELEVKLSVEPDPDMRGADWWIAAVAVRASSTPEGKLKELDVPKGTWLHSRIVAYAGEHLSQSITADFEEWRGQMLEEHGREAFA